MINNWCIYILFSRYCFDRTHKIIMSLRKIESVQTKRRKIRKEIEFVNRTLLQSNDLKSSECILPTADNILEINDSNSKPSPNNLNINNNYNSINNSNNNQQHNNYISNEFLTSNNLSPSTSSFISTNLSLTDSIELPIQHFLATWAIDFKIPQTAVNGLLKGLKMHECFKNLPTDCRTILMTPRNESKNIRNVHPGLYIIILV